MKFLKTIFFSAFLITAFAFKNPSGSEIYGAYGISKKDSANVGLTIKEDKTFSYRYYSEKNELTETQGEWEMKNGMIILKNYPPDLSFHTKWKITDNGTVAKSRKGLNFYRFIKL